MLTDKRVDEIFAEMGQYVLELENDPGMLGPQYFQDKIAICRGHLNRVSLVDAELKREKLAVGGDLRRQEAVYAMEYDNLIANDQRVKALANIEDRKATAGFILREQRALINGLKDRLANLDGVHRLVAYRNRELQATMTAIRDQRRLMQTELSTGAFYGDERPSRGPRPIREATGGMAVEDDVSALDLEALMAEPDPAAEPDSEVPAEEVKPADEVKAAPVGPIVSEAENPLDSLLEETIVSSTNAPVEAASLVQATAAVGDEEAMLRFLDAPTEDLPQAVVEEPNHKVPAGTEVANDVDDFLSILEGL